MCEANDKPLSGTLVEYLDIAVKPIELMPDTPKQRAIARYVAIAL